MKIRRMIAVIVALALGAGLVGLGQGGTAAADDGTVASPTLSIYNPGAGQTRVRAGAVLAFGGTAAPGAQLAKGRLLSITPEGEIDRAYNLSSLSLQLGSFSGQTTYPGPNTAAAHDGQAVLEVTMLHEDEEHVIRSNGLRIDLVRPYIVGTSLVAPDTVKVQFSEPVHINDPFSDADLVVDWRVKDAPPLDIRRDPDDGSVRYLTVKDGTANFDEDDTPTVKLLEFIAGTQSLPKHWYLDRALWILEPEMNRTTLAKDAIAPAKPVLEAIAGQANNGIEEIIGNDSDPEFELSGMRTGHIGQIYLETNGQDGFQADGDALLGEATAGEDGTASITPEEPLDDDSYKVYGVARDRAKCQPADAASAECPNYSQAAPGFYTLDTVPPLALLAETTLRNNVQSDPIVRVRFSERVFSDDEDAAQWTVTGTQVESVSTNPGQAQVRELNTTTLAPNLAQVFWTKPSEGGYADRAGNALELVDLTATNGVPPIVTLDPDLAGNDAVAPIYRRNGDCPPRTEGRVCFVITGEVDGATHLLVHNAPDAQDFELPADADRFSIEVDLLPRQRNEDVLIEPIRLVPNPQDPQNPTEIRGPMARLRTIVHDDQEPVVTVGALGRPLHDGSVGFKGMDQATISWTATDPNLVPGPIKIDLSTDGGQTWENIADGKTNTDGNAGTFGWSVPAVNTASAMIRVTATDQVGFKESAVSNEFVIDSKLPSFTPETQLDEAGNATRVLLTFSEPVVFDDELGNQWNQWQIQEEGQPPVPAQSAVPVDSTLGDDGITMIRKLMLTTGFVDGAPSPVQQHLDRNGTPRVEYVVPQGGEDIADQFRDRADNLLASYEAFALDRIAPLAPTKVTARHLIRERTEPVKGEAEADPRLDVMVRRISPGATFSDGVTVQESGSPLGQATGLFTVDVNLATNRVNQYEAWVQDPAGNVSPVAPVGIENDRKKPRVKVLKPKKFRKSGKRFLRIKWRTIERNKQNVDVHFRLKGKYTSKRLRNMVRSTPDDGSYKWRIPRKFWGKKFKVTIVARDQVGNNGARGYRWIRL